MDESVTFQSMYDKFMKTLQKEGMISNVTAKFTECYDDCERTELVSRLPQFNEDFPVARVVSCKFGAKAAECKDLGNTLYRNKKFLKALEMYTSGIFFSPSDYVTAKEGGNMLGILYANRSAVLFHLKNFPKCVQDIDRAITHGYPSSILYKLYDRKGKCCFHMGMIEAAQKVLGDGLRALAGSSLEKEEKNTRARDLMLLIQKCKNSLNGPQMQSYADDISAADESKLPHISSVEQHPIFLSASKNFELTYVSDKGRLGIAARDIHPGEVIMVDKPFAKVLLPPFYVTHCFHCLMRCQALVPCRQCSKVGFCSDTCEDDAWTQYHSVECLVLSQVISSEVGLGFLALRVALKAGFGHLLSFKNFAQFGHSPVRKGVNSDGYYDPSSYMTIHSLIGNTEQRSVADLFQRSVKASFLLKLLQATPYFPTDASPEDVYFIGSILLKQLQMLPCNAHEVSELIYSGSFATAETKEIGSAIYPTLSLLNHSCDPSVVRHCYGGTCVLRAIKTIKLGEEIVDNYGTVYAVSCQNERQRLLQSQYYFTCQCPACIGDWPLYNELPSGEPTFKCPSCDYACTIQSQNTSIYLLCEYCKNKVDFSSQYENFKKARGAFMEGKTIALSDGRVGSHFSAFLHYLKLMSNYVSLPWQEFNDCQEIIKQCLSMLANCHHVYDHNSE